MYKLATVSRIESGDNCNSEFDYQTDFRQFLEEARNNAEQVTPKTAHFEETRKRQLDWEKKKVRSWKSSLFSWLKTDKKSKSMKQSSNETVLVSKTRRGYVSGPVGPTIGGVRSRAQRAASGPLIGLCSSQEEYAVPYMCLGQLNNSSKKLQSYGPLYLVT